MTDTSVAVIGGGVVGAAVLYTVAHRGVDATLLEADSALAYAASGTSSGILHSGFDSTPGELETELILRGGRQRDRVLDALDIPVLRCGAELRPHGAGDRDTIARLADKARRNGVTVEIRDDDGGAFCGEAVRVRASYARSTAGDRDDFALEPSDVSLLDHRHPALRGRSGPGLPRSAGSLERIVAIACVRRRPAGVRRRRPDDR